MITVEVRVDPPYPVRIGPGALHEADRWLPAGRVALVADANVAPLHGEAVTRSLRAADRDVLPLVVPAGEGAKSVTVWEELLRTLASAGFGRDDAVLAVGGGVVTDLAGFVAASYARGIAVVHAPTSLLGMADAAIGGKTGINLPEGKNLVGAFWQPRAVLMDVTTLRTLPADVFAAGAVEVFKHGLLADPDLAAAVVDGRLSLQADDDALTRWLAASARVKADVVARDALETGGARATLNLGHTVAHALEAISAHAIDHGGAVAWGLLYAAHLSREDARRHGRPHQDWSEPCRCLLRRVRPSAPTTQRFEDLLPFLARDKKNRAGRRRWVLADAPGHARLADGVEEADERAAWRAFREDVRTLADEAGAGASLGPEGGSA
jgi:3-dehydroquinate synthase